MRELLVDLVDLLAGPVGLGGSLGLDLDGGPGHPMAELLVLVVTEPDVAECLCDGGDGQPHYQLLLPLLLPLN